jgi:hypothetical protein
MISEQKPPTHHQDAATLPIMLPEWKPSLAK